MQENNDTLTYLLKEFAFLKEKLTYQTTLNTEMPIRSQEQHELFAALSKSQSEMPIAQKTSTNPFFKSTYASFSDVIKASRACLTKNNLCVSQDIIERENGQKYLYTVLGHASGQFKASRIQISPPKTDIQEFGKYVSYLKRYAYAAIVGVADAQEDDDGESVMTDIRKKEQISNK